MSIASRPAAAPRSMARAGSPAGPASSYRCGFSRACSDGCSYATCRTPMTPARCVSPVRSPTSPTPAPSTHVSPTCAASIGWSTPSRRSAGRARRSPISVATPIASPSPTAGCSRSKTARSASPGSDYRKDGLTKVMTLDAAEFIRRFLLHILPDGFHRIRHYGFLANGDRRDNLDRCRRLIAHDAAAECATTEPTPAVDRVDDKRTQSDALRTCPECGGLMRRTALAPRPSREPHPFFCDTS